MCDGVYYTVPLPPLFLFCVRVAERKRIGWSMHCDLQPSATMLYSSQNKHTIPLCPTALCTGTQHITAINQMADGSRLYILCQFVIFLPLFYLFLYVLEWNQTHVQLYQCMGSGVWTLRDGDILNANQVKAVITGTSCHSLNQVHNTGRRLKGKGESRFSNVSIIRLRLTFTSVRG